MPEGFLVVLPTLGDRLETLELALASVTEQVVDAPVRLVVVVPSSAAEARALADKHGAVIVDDPRRGLAAAMNEGVGARESEAFYVGLGDDDLLRPGSLAFLGSLAKRTPDAVVYYGACDYIDAEGRVIGTNSSGDLAKHILPWGPNLIPHPGSLIRLDSLLEVGGFAEDLPYTMDLDAFLKLRRKGRLVSTRRVVSAFRWHSESLTVADRRRSASEALRVKRNHLPRGMRTISMLLLGPIAWLTSNAGRVVSARSRRMKSSAGIQPSTGGEHHDARDRP